MQSRHFAGGLDLRVTGQDLLDERAAGTGHAEDEDWRLRGIAQAGETIEQPGVERLGDEPELLLTGHFIVRDFVRRSALAVSKCWKDRG